MKQISKRKSFDFKAVVRLLGKKSPEEIVELLGVSVEEVEKAIDVKKED